MSLFVHELVHITLSAIAAAICIYMSRRVKKKLRRELYSVIILGAILGGFFIDLDHLIDYVMAFGLNFNINLFLTGEMFAQLGKIHVFFHAWEYVLILWFLVYKTKNVKLKYFFLSLSLGMLSHLIFDTYVNEVSLLGYSIIYRMIHNFDMSFITHPL